MKRESDGMRWLGRERKRREGREEREDMSDLQLKN